MDSKAIACGVLLVANLALGMAVFNLAILLKHYANADRQERITADLALAARIDLIHERMAKRDGL